MGKRKEKTVIHTGVEVVHKSIHRVIHLSDKAFYPKSTGPTTATKQYISN